MRNFYFNNDNRDGASNPSRTEEWAQGFMLNYQSGFTEGTVGFGVDALGLLGIRLDSGDGRHVGSSMIPDDGKGAAEQWSRFGATAKMRVARRNALWHADTEVADSAGQRWTAAAANVRGWADRFQ